MFTGGVRLLLEAVQNIDRFLKLGDVHHPEPAIVEIDDDFLRSSTHIVERLPAIRFQSDLNLSKLAPRLSTSIRSENVIILDRQGSNAGGPTYVPSATPPVGLDPTVSTEVSMDRGIGDQEIRIEDIPF